MCSTPLKIITTGLYLPLSECICLHSTLLLSPLWRYNNEMSLIRMACPLFSIKFCWFLKLCVVLYSRKKGENRFIYVIEYVCVRTLLSYPLWYSTKKKLYIFEWLLWWLIYTLLYSQIKWSFFLNDGQKSNEFTMRTCVFKHIVIVLTMAYEKIKLPLYVFVIARRRHKENLIKMWVSFCERHVYNLEENC